MTRQQEDLFDILSTFTIVASIIGAFILVLF